MKRLTLYIENSIIILKESEARYMARIDSYKCPHCGNDVIFPLDINIEEETEAIRAAEEYCECFEAKFNRKCRRILPIVKGDGKRKFELISAKEADMIKSIALAVCNDLLASAVVKLSCGDLVSMKLKDGQLALKRKRSVQDSETI